MAYKVSSCQIMEADHKTRKDLATSHEDVQADSQPEHSHLY